MPTQNQVLYSYEEYAAALGDGVERSTFKGKKYRNWELRYLSVNKLAIQWGQTGGAGALEGVNQGGGGVILVPTQNAQAMSANGQSFDDNSLLAIKSGGEFCISATNYTGWFIVFVSDELISESHEGVRANFAAASTLVRVAPDRAQRFRSAMIQLGRAVQSQPGAFDSSAAMDATARRIQDAVSEAFRGELHVMSVLDRSVTRRRQIIRSAMDFVDQHEGDYLAVKDLAHAAGVSQRTLHAAFHEYFSVGPARYLKLRTLHQARGRLKAADPSKATVTEIAAQLGVWELGRFAHDYHFLFGELPSETLRHV